MKEYRVKPDSKLNLDKYDPNDTGEYEKTDQGKEQVKTITAELTAKLDRLQERLYANADRSLLIVLQGMDTSGKDGTIKLHHTHRPDFQFGRLLSTKSHS